MSKLYLGSIDLNKIDKSNIVTKDKDGNAFKNGAKYLNISIWLNDKADDYGNHIGIKAGTKENNYYIGNAKEWKSTQQEKVDASIDVIDTEEDDLPF